MTTTTFSTPLIAPDQPRETTPLGVVVYMIEQTVTKVTQSQLNLNIEQIDTYLEFLHQQLEMYTTQGNSEKQSETETTIDRWNGWRNYIQSNLDDLGYTENPEENK